MWPWLHAARYFQKFGGIFSLRCLNGSAALWCRAWRHVTRLARLHAPATSTQENMEQKQGGRQQRGKWGGGRWLLLALSLTFSSVLDPLKNNRRECRQGGWGPYSELEQDGEGCEKAADSTACSCLAEGEIRTGKAVWTTATLMFPETQSYWQQFANSRHRQQWDSAL